MLDWIHQAHCIVCAILSLPSDLRPISFVRHSSCPVWWWWLCPVGTASCKPLLHPGTEAHQEGFSSPTYNPAVCHTTLLLRPCSELASWTWIFSFVKHTQKPLLSFPLRATTLVSIQTNRSWEYSVSAGWKTFQVLCALAFLARHRTL